ncbi:hypothetical protein LVJ94_31920 [Pendulispora rubella]|uniref:Alpha-L-rhamnosidase six-hairpin glycosidase domain-containing protein n=1 Tax=Pendulispora rubella TaxID=2741070 RepID=A0ABZ2KW36_9BACT
MRLSRRALLAAGGAVAVGAFGGCRRREPTSIPVDLSLRADGRGVEVVNFGLPLPPEWLYDAADIRVVDRSGAELPSALGVIETFALGGSIRAVQVQTEVDFSAATSTTLFVEVGKRQGLTRPMVPIEETLLDPDGLQGPRVLAVLPADWLCDSLVAGPQVPAHRSGDYAAYDAAVERNFPGSLRYVNSPTFSHWLFDRTSTWYKQYTRTGAAKFLDAAYRAGNFVRVNTELEGPDAGTFKLKGRDLKYVYPQAMHLHFLLSGDTRARAAADKMAHFCLTTWDPRYRPELYTQPPPDADPEKDRLFWTTRNEAYSLLGIVHGWEMTGDVTYLRAIDRHIDALAAHQAAPPDGRPADGSWRQNWALYDPSETLLPGATSPWMTALLLAALGQAFRVTFDPRIPEMIVRWCDFLDRKGFVSDAVPYYIVDCFGSESIPALPGDPPDSTAMHDMELAHSMAMGIFFTRDRAQRARFRKRFDALFARGVQLDLNGPPRAYNWAFHASSELIPLLQSSRA